MGLGFASEELLLAESELGLETVDFRLEEFLAGHGSLMHALPEGGLTPGLKLSRQTGTDRTGIGRQRWRRANRTVARSWQRHSGGG